MSQNISLWGATYSDVPSVLLPKSGGGTASFTDVTDTTATADKILQGYTAYGADGSKLTGTATGGGGSVTQDQDGYIVLPPDGGGSPSVGGLVYETGTWTPTVDISDTTISFTNSHTDDPILVMICDADTSARNADSNVFSIIGNVYGFLGFNVEQGSTERYGLTFGNYATSSGLSAYYVNISNIGTLSTWVSASGFKAYTNSASRYWRAGRTYKWIAVWAPTT